jgi:fatty-acyl-CoA synthase
VPRYVRFVSEFPMTASGKIQKYKLREEHQKILAS